MVTFAGLRRDGTLIALTFDGSEDTRPAEPIAPAKHAERTSRPGPNTLDGLPPPDEKRWTARRKAAVVIAIRDGRLLREEACRRYQLSREELLAREEGFKTDGNAGLYVARLLQHRRP